MTHGKRKVGADSAPVQNASGAWQYEAKLRKRARGRRVYAKVAPATDPATGLPCDDARTLTVRPPEPRHHGRHS